MRKEPWNMEKEYWKDIPKENRQVLIQYLKDRLNSDRKELGTVINERSILLRLSRHIKNKSYIELTERDMLWTWHKIGLNPHNKRHDSSCGHRADEQTKTDNSQRKLTP